ncbi:MAG: hypothetical protein JRH15_18370, partial [Deltaproteobacteria bacterium]|nr:hypothetical protein [Deltaproteobacteria bacterium]
DDIVGTWSWVQSSGGIAGILETPESTGESRKVVFDDQGNVTYYTDNIVTLSSTYSLGESLTIFSDEPVPVVYVEGQLTLAYSFPACGELELAEDVFDGFIHLYQK